MERGPGPLPRWCPQAPRHTAAMRRRLALCAAISLLALAGCQSPRAQSAGSSRLSEPTMSSPLPVVQPRHPTDAPRYHQYDPL